ncbi:P-loop containing nucleoside triphosphate hydrolase protein [Dendrothele bispora CBS 962.96]|uniref:P-loop containing nucleoside triphosphate hydrolase protein n=1 Tax=Dendrothele bispora (strain CBS 962.96) TaxID=1314807 RepID=A0A4S8M8Q5_DENBC|nr:P-loop containing nucleoside triphosphate hydrolase protein [Dendrothele bispora CBS 962.96]
MVLEASVKDTLLADCSDFLKSEKCEASGIPFRRGYLLHGVPGSGKTSLVYSLAGELGLNIYVVSLSSKGMCDNTLTTLMGNAQSPCILLLEDLDAAFTRTPDNNNGSTLSLSGLLNSIDGVAAPQGRLLFITTNHFNLLDPALRRAGRIDRYIEFTYATKEQAEDLFKDASQHDLTCSERKSDSEGHSTLLIKPPEISELAARFARAIPEKTVSVAGLQGYLVKNKTRPRACVEEVERSTLAEFLNITMLLK